MLESEATLFEMLVYKAADRFAHDAHTDGELDGDHRILHALAKSRFMGKEEFERPVEALIRERDERLQERNVDVESVWREFYYDHYAHALHVFTRHGYLDHAPVHKSSDGKAFL